MRTFDTVVVEKAIETYAEKIIGLDISDWLCYTTNIALTNQSGDIALFERQWRQPSTVCGHYFFHSRGRQAIDAANGFLAELFSGPYEVEVVTGLTPSDHRAALWMNKRLGFKSHGSLTVDDRDYEFVMLTKHEWLQLGGSKE
jgi:hypothetical protein